MKASEILKNLVALNEVSQKSLPIKLSYAISVNIGKLQAAAKHIEEQRMKLLERYADQDADGKPVIKNNHYQIGDGNMPELTKEMDSLMEEDTEIEIRKVPLECLDLCDNPRCDMLSAKDILALDFMIANE